MIDITTTRTMAMQMHPPTIVFVMLFGLALAASLLAGYGMTGSKMRSRFHMLGFALVMAVAVFASSTSNTHAWAWFEWTRSTRPWLTCASVWTETFRAPDRDKGVAHGVAARASAAAPVGIGEVSLKLRRRATENTFCANAGSWTIKLSRRSGHRVGVYQIGDV
jgi:hypothetical protein